MKQKVEAEIAYDASFEPNAEALTLLLGKLGKFCARVENRMHTD